MTHSRRVGIGVADVELQDDAAGNAVDRAGIDVAGADGGDGVDRAGGEGVFFDGEDEFGGGAERISTVGHQQRSGVAAEAIDGEAIASGGGDAGDDAERDCLRVPAEDPARCAVRARRGSGRLAACTEASGPVKPAAAADSRRE